MYVQAYLDLSHCEVSCGLLFFPWLVQLGVAVAGCALVAVACCCLFLRDFFLNGSYMSVSPSHLRNGLRPN